MAQTCELTWESAPAAAAAACAVCGGAGLEPFLDLGETPLANAFPASRTGPPQPCYPLRAARCVDCGHAQLLDRVPPEAMFSHYLYVSSASSTLTAHLDGLAGEVTARAGLGGGGLVVDAGSNDGTLLAAFARRGARTVGVDPAANLAAIAGARGIPTEVSCFDTGAAARVLAAHGPARAITATNSFPHVQDLDEYMRAVDLLLAPDGVFVLEAHYLLDMLEQTAFDTIYHEHVSYWALGPMKRLLERHGFAIADVERLPVHHGQLRVWVARRGVARPAAAVERAEAAERAAGLGTARPFREFAERARRLRWNILALLEGLRGARVAAYGAPAKGMTLLSVLGLGPETIAYIADRSPLKQGRFTPGSAIPIVPPAHLLADRPDYTLLLAWNFAEEILAELRPYTDAGGRVVVPVPEVRILP